MFFKKSSKNEPTQKENNILAERGLEPTAALVNEVNKLKKTSVARPEIESMAVLMIMMLITSMIEEHQYIHRGSDSFIFVKNFNKIKKNQEIIKKEF